MSLYIIMNKNVTLHFKWHTHKHNTLHYMCDYLQPYVGVSSFTLTLSHIQYPLITWKVFPQVSTNYVQWLTHKIQLATLFEICCWPFVFKQSQCSALFSQIFTSWMLHWRTSGINWRAGQVSVKLLLSAC